MEAGVGTIALIVECVAPEEGFANTQRRVSHFLKGGVPAVILLYPEERIVALFRQHTHLAVFRKGEEAELAAVLPDFRCSIGALFDDNGGTTA